MCLKLYNHFAHKFAQQRAKKANFAILAHTFVRLENALFIARVCFCHHCKALDARNAKKLELVKSAYWFKSYEQKKIFYVSFECEMSLFGGQRRGFQGIRFAKSNTGKIIFAQTGSKTNQLFLLRNTKVMSN